jgi:UDP-3-O-[3-hydroxymyristoyl] glucosamine N-acyltransferase
LKASELAKLLNAELKGQDCELKCISPIDNITDGSLVPVLGKDFPESVLESSASAFLLKTGLEVGTDKTLIYSDDPEIALVNAANAMYPPTRKKAGVHPNAFVADSAKLGENVSVGAFAYIGEGAVVGDNTQIYQNVSIGDGAVLGSDCIIYANVSIYDSCTIKDRVIIHSGTVIGSDGFGYYQRKGENIKIPHLGSVVIEDDVEIGSNSCVDKGKFTDTVIGVGTKIDNQVQIAHNVKIGRSCILAGQSAVAGSSIINDFVMMGGRAGVRDHVEICSKVMLAGNTGVMSDITKPGIYAGVPHNTRKSWMREVALTRELPEIVKRLTELERKIND